MLLPEHAALHFIAWVLCAVAVLVIGTAIWTCLRAGVDMRPGAHAAALVIQGPFRYTRNPMYVAVIALYTGICLACGLVWPLLTLPAGIWVVHRHVTFEEERYLRARFGDEYVQYTKHVRRWL